MKKLRINEQAIMEEANKYTHETREQKLINAC